MVLQILYPRLLESESPGSLLGLESTTIAMATSESDFKGTDHIAIIGAGLADLVAAIALAKSGYKVTILKRDAELREVRRAYTTKDIASPSLRLFFSGEQAYKFLLRKGASPDRNPGTDTSPLDPTTHPLGFVL